MLIEYSHNFSVFYFVSQKVRTAALKILCVMIPSLVDTSSDFGLFGIVILIKLLLQLQECIVKFEFAVSICIHYPRY